MTRSDQLRAEADGLRARLHTARSRSERHAIARAIREAESLALLYDRQLAPAGATDMPEIRVLSRDTAAPEAEQPCLQPCLQDPALAAEHRRGQEPGEAGRA